MRVALKVYLTVERLMIEHDQLETTSEEEMDLIHDTCLRAWDMLTDEERAELKKRDQPTREERNPTKIIFASTPRGDVYRCYCGGITRHSGLCCECGRGNPDACCQNRNPHLVHCDVARRMAP